MAFDGDNEQPQKPDLAGSKPEFDLAGSKEEKGAFEKTAEQAVFGVRDVTRLLSFPIRATVGDLVFDSESDFGLKFVPPEDATVGVPGATPPTDVLGSGFRLAGQAVVGGPVLGRLTGLANAPAALPASTKLPLLSRVFRGGKKFISEAGETFKRHPVVSTAIETGLGFSAGLGGGFASEAFPDSAAARFTGEVAGGVLPAVTPTAIVIRVAGGLRSMVNKARHPFTASGGEIRAKGRVDRAVPTGEQGKVLSELDTPTTIDPATGQPVLTLAQRTGDENLLSLERSIIESTETLTREAGEQIANANAVIQKSLDDIGTSPIASTIEDFEAARNYLSNLLDTRMKLAAQRTNERLRDFGPNLTREQANLIAREEIDAALAAAKTQEKQLFDLLDPDSVVPFGNALSTLKRFQSELGKAQQKDIAPVAKIIQTLQGDFGTKIRGVERIDVPAKTKTTLKELRAVQSELRQVARNARSGDNKNLNMARIADDIADSITDDIALIEGGPEVAAAVDSAISFSRNLNTRFRQGAVGKILGRDVTGAPRVKPGLTLEQSIGLPDVKAREGLDDLFKAFDSPEAPSSKILIDSTEDYLRTKFLKEAVRNDQLNVQSAEKFLEKNQEILSRLPNLVRQIDEVIESGKTTAIKERQRSRVILDDYKVSKSAMLIGKGPVETFRQTARMKPQAAAKEMQLLINKAAKDQTGESLEGLKSGFMEFLTAGAKGKSRDVKGNPFLSGFAIKDAMDNPTTKAMMKKLYSKEELKRIDVIVKDLINLEKGRGVQASAEGIIGDKPSKILETIAGVAGAAVGRKVAILTGGGTVQTPGILASRFRELTAAGVSDPAGRLLRDIIKDEELFKALIKLELTPEGELSKAAVRRLNVWAFSVLAEYGGATEEDTSASDTFAQAL